MTSNYGSATEDRATTVSQMASAAIVWMQSTFKDGISSAACGQPDRPSFYPVHSFSAAGQHAPIVQLIDLSVGGQVKAGAVFRGLNEIAAHAVLEAGELA